MSELRHAMTIDVEDYFHVSAFSRDVAKSSWASRESRVERNTLDLLDLFDGHDVKSTFFVLGWVAEQIPTIVPEIVRRGHEVSGALWSDPEGPAGVDPCASA